jgi:hypothetical protein
MIQRRSLMMATTRKGFGVLILLACLVSYPCLADEILFQDQKGPQTGTVVSEDAQSVTIRFSKDSIKSITKSQEGSTAAFPGTVVWEERGDYLILKIPRHAIQIESPETPVRASSNKLASPPTSAVPAKETPSPPEKGSTGAAQVMVTQAPESSKNVTVHQELLQEEMGRVEGVIAWQGKPLKNAKVKIVLETYTGFSIAAVKKMVVGGKGQSPEQGVSFETETDSEGRYSFLQVPPGYYRLYWVPDPQTGWVRRLREKPDFEVTPGNLTVQDIPEKKE